MGRQDREEAQQHRAFIDNPLELFGSPLSSIFLPSSPPDLSGSLNQTPPDTHHHAGRPHQPTRTTHCTPKLHLLPEARPDPDTHTPSSSRKEVQFPWQCVTANEGKKEDKEV